MTSKTAYSAQSRHLNDVHRIHLQSLLRKGGMSVDPLSKTLEVADKYDLLDDEFQGIARKHIPHIAQLNEALRKSRWIDAAAAISGRTIDAWMEICFYNSIFSITTSPPRHSLCEVTIPCGIFVPHQPIPTPINASDSESRRGSLLSLGLKDVLISFHNRHSAKTAHFTFNSDRIFDNVSVYNIDKFGRQAIKAYTRGEIYVYMNTEHDYELLSLETAFHIDSVVRFLALTTTIAGQSFRYLNLQISYAY
jgi:hypothetical protein